MKMSELEWVSRWGQGGEEDVVNESFSEKTWESLWLAALGSSSFSASASVPSFSVSLPLCVFIYIFISLLCKCSAVLLSEWRGWRSGWVDEDARQWLQARLTQRAAGASPVNMTQSSKTSNN